MIADSVLQKFGELRIKSNLDDSQEDMCFLMQSYSGLKYSLISGLCENSPSDASSKPDTAFIPKKILNTPIIYVEMLPNFVVGYTTRQKGDQFVMSVINKEIDIPLDLAHSSPKELGGILFMEITISD